MASDQTAGIVPLSPSERRRARGNMPGWMSVAVVAACLVGGGWLLWWFVAGSPPRERTIMLKEVPRQARRRDGGGGGGAVGNVFRQLARTATGVLVVKNDEWRVKSPGDAIMRVLKRPDGRFDCSFYYDRNDLVPPDELALLIARAEVVNDEDAARALDITPRQMATFKKLQSQTGMAISEAERNELTAMWEKWVGSPDAESQAAVERSLVERLGVVGKKNLEATKQQMSGRAGLVRSILTPQQLENVRQRRR